MTVGCTKQCIVDLRTDDPGCSSSMLSFFSYKVAGRSAGWRYFFLLICQFLPEYILHHGLPHIFFFLPFCHCVATLHCCDTLLFVETVLLSRYMRPRDLFWHCCSVLFMSLHRYDDGSFYPSEPAAAPSVVGNGKAAGYTVNIAWNEVSLCCVAALHTCICTSKAYRFLLFVLKPLNLLLSLYFSGCLPAPEPDLFHLTTW